MKSLSIRTAASAASLAVLVALPGCGGGGGGAVLPSALPTSIKLNTFQAASQVMGQPNFTANAINQGGGATPSANTFWYPTGNPSLVGAALYLPDSNNSRVLRFNTVPTVDNANADFVLGQTSFNTGSTGNLATQMSTASSVQSDGTHLVAVDSGNNRVLIWNSLPSSMDQPADVVVGQTAFGNSGAGCTGSTLNNPKDVALAGGKLIVVDRNNARVLIWNSIPLTNGVAANVVLGQPDFTTCTTVSASAQSFATPSGVWSDGTRLIVADRGNNRVLIWNSVPVNNQQAADSVLGQATMTASANGVLPTGMSHPIAVTSNGVQLFVADELNNRVLVWNSMPMTDDAPADVVLGQGDFNHSTCNDQDQDGTQDPNPTAQTLCEPWGLAVAGNVLVVSDSLNSRALIFRGQ